MAKNVVRTNDLKVNSPLKKDLFKIVQSNEEILDFLLEHSSEGFWFKRFDLPHEEWVSPALWKALGLSGFSNEVHVLERVKRIVETDVKRYEKFLVEIRKAPTKIHSEKIRYIHKTGAIRLFHCQAKVIFDQASKPMAIFCGHVEDETEEYQQSQFLLKAVSENFPNSCISVIHEDLTIGFTAGQEFRKRGMNPFDYVGRHINEVFAPLGSDVLEMVKNAYLNTLKGIPQSFDLIVGDEFQHYETVPLPSSDGVIRSVLSVVQNVTERRKSMEVLMESEAQLSLAAELAKLGYWELDITTGLFTFNDHFYRLLKTDVKEMGGYKIPIKDFVNRFCLEDDRDLIARESNWANENKDGDYDRYLEHRFVNAEGEIGYVAIRFLVIRDGNGIVIKTVGASQDITERKRAEESMKTLLKTTSQQNDRLREFSYMTSHHIRSSVSNLMGIVDIIEGDEQTSQWLSMLKLSVQKLDTTIRNINELLNFEKSFSRDDMILCSLSEAMNRIMELNRKSLQDENIDIQVSIPQACSVKAIPAYLDSIFNSLLVNAIKYGVNEVSRTIEVAAQKTANGTMISFTDFGNGIDLHRHGEKLFKLGTRLHASSDGQGMGLFMTKHQLKAMGALIDLESEVGEGTIFKIYFND